MIGCYDLGLITEDLDTIQSVGLLNLLNYVFISTCQLVHLDDSIKSPVSYEEILFEDDQ